MEHLNHLRRAMLVAFTFTTTLQMVGARAAPIISSLATRQAAVGFKLIQDGMLSSAGLAPACEQVLYQEISCDPFVQTLGEKTYHGSLGDASLTDAVCAASCTNALATARRRISGACASTPEILPGYPVLALIDSVVTGRDETCLKDTETGKYCNDIIESWDPVDELEDIPQDQICSYCYGSKLSMMQHSPYSFYDEFQAEILEYINQNCGQSYPTEPQDPVSPSPGIPEGPECATGNVYTTQAGDTCDSIALANSVSAATLYYINPSLLSCATIPESTTLCLPPSCETTYTVQEGESCIEIAVREGTSWSNLVAWNSGLDSRCSNIWSTDPFWGRIVCVSAPGGLPDGGGEGNEGGSPGNGGIGGPGGSGDGYADVIVDPPEGATVAPDTTLECGDFIQAQSGVGCSTMVANNAVPMDLFLAANPSLGSAVECTGNLVVGSWYCLHPTRYFDQE